MILNRIDRKLEPNGKIPILESKALKKKKEPANRHQKLYKKVSETGTEILSSGAISIIYHIHTKFFLLTFLRKLFFLEISARPILRLKTNRLFVFHIVLPLTLSIFLNF